MRILETPKRTEHDEFASGGYTRANRPSPSDSATEYDEGYIKRGNDESLWRISVAGNGVHRWVKLRPEEQGQYKEGDTYGSASSGSYQPPHEHTSEKRTFEPEKTPKMEKNAEIASFAGQVNSILSKTMFHYQVGDIISSAIGTVFHYKGRLQADDGGNTLTLLLEPQRKPSLPDYKYIKIRVGITGYDTISVKVEYDQNINGQESNFVLWEGGGRPDGFFIDDMPELQEIISGHKKEIAKNYQEGISKIKKAPAKENYDILSDKKMMKVGFEILDKIKKNPTFFAESSDGMIDKWVKENYPEYYEKYIMTASKRGSTHMAELQSIQNIAKRYLQKSSPMTKTTEEAIAASPAPEVELENKDIPEHIRSILNDRNADALEYNMNCRRIVEHYKGKNLKFPYDPSGEKIVELPAEVLNYLSGYTGMGGLDFDAGKEILYEYYTPDPIIERMWGLAYKHGYKETGSVLEPSVATGRFLKYASSLAEVTACEVNWFSYCIAQLIYGKKAKILHQYFEQFFIKNNLSIKGNTDNLTKYDLIIGNPPYGNFTGKYAGMGEKAYTHARNQVEYFIMRGLDLLKPNGLLVYIIGTEKSAGGTPFLDQQDSPVKKMIAERGELIDAYRMPSGIFDRTGVDTDVIVMKKK